MGQRNVADVEIAELIRNTTEAASAYIRGDIHRYLTLIKHGDDYTLMPPYGGEPRRGFDTKEALETTPKMFRGGEADLELVKSYASGDMAVLVAIERQHARPAGSLASPSPGTYGHPAGLRPRPLVTGPPGRAGARNARGCRRGFTRCSRGNTMSW
jgi:hypothetical protein